jgi:transcriptional regulator with XRE-family HTH domain
MYEIFEELLKTNNVTAYKVGKETGIASSTFTAWKNGVSNPKPEKLQKIADYFGVSIDKLMGREDGPSKKLRVSAKGQLNAIMNEYPTESLRLLSKLCKKSRIEKDMTERSVSVSTGIGLDEYLDFENRSVNIGIDNIINILNWFKYDITYINGYLTGILVEQKETAAETEKLIERLLLDEDFKHELLKDLEIRASMLKNNNLSNSMTINESAIDNLLIGLKSLLGEEK